MKQVTILALAAGLAALLTSCNKDSNAGYYSVHDYALLSQYLNLPPAPPEFGPQVGAAGASSSILPVNSDMATLGKVLFYDKKLSKDGKIACASCHRQEFAFGDNTALSKGVFDRSGDRNAIALMSVPSISTFYGTNLTDPNAKRFFWDNRAPTAPAQCRMSLTDPKEMDMDMAEIVKIVEAQPYYEPLFRMAYTDSEVTEDRVTNAISAFVNSIGSLNSRFDQAVKDAHFENSFDVNYQDLPMFTPEENLGKQIYMSNCAKCHSYNQITPSLDVSNGTLIPLHQASNGLDEHPVDLGVGAISLYAGHKGTFKVPLLRNIARSAPYMHDGRFSTLEEVVEHYNSGIQPHENLHHLLKDADGTPIRLNLLQQEKAALVAFLRTLTDESILADERYANPFR